MKIDLPEGSFTVPDKTEQRAFALKGDVQQFQIEERADKPDEPVIKGHAAVFERETQLWPGLMEKIAKGAFKDSIDGDIRALWAHDTSLPLGRTTNKSLRVWEDDQGLAFELTLNRATNVGRDAYEHIKRGDVSSMSFGFRVKKESWTKGEGGKPHLRTLEKLDLLEVSPVVFPAYPQTDVAARQWDNGLIKEIESILSKIPEDQQRSADPESYVGSLQKIRADLIARGIL